MTEGAAQYIAMRSDCENHYLAGKCTQECADLVAAMTCDYDPDYSYDPTGCRNPKPMPWTVVKYDDVNKRVVIALEHPEDCQCGDKNCPPYLQAMAEHLNHYNKD